MLDRLFSGSIGDTCRYSIAGLIVMALGVALTALAGRLAGGVGSGRYFVFKIGGMLLVMVGALVAVRLF